MFTIDSTVDSIQTAKKKFVSTFVTNKVAADAMNKFVDAQAAYTKEALKTFEDVGTTLMIEANKSFKEFGKFDYFKFGEGVMKAYTAQSAAKTK
jgi:hypothetical protein